MISDTRTTPFRCLVIDDDQIIHALLSSFLRDEGYEVASALSGEEGVTKTIDFLPHIIFMDLEMPGINGLETTKQVRELGNIPAPIIIAFTSARAPEMRQECLDAGMDDFLLKPFSPEG